jgi:hypothetical protein
MTPRQRPCRHAASRPPASGARYPAAACTTIRWLRHRQRRPPPAGAAPALLSDGPVQRTARIDRPHRARAPVAGWAGVNGQCQPTVSHQTGARIGNRSPLADAGGRPPPTARPVFGVARRLTRRSRRSARQVGRSATLSAPRRTARYYVRSWQSSESCGPFATSAPMRWRGGGGGVRWPGRPVGAGSHLGAALGSVVLGFAGTGA